MGQLKKVDDKSNSSIPEDNRPQGDTESSDGKQLTVYGSGMKLDLPYSVSNGILTFSVSQGSYTQGDYIVVAKNGLAVTSLSIHEDIMNKLVEGNYTSKTLVSDVADGDESPNEYFKIIETAKIIETEAELRELVNLVMTAHNVTRMKLNRGNTPLELAKMEPRAPKPTIVPGSTESAKMLDEAANHLKEMGLHVDLNADIVNGKKVYPNDPCPCGSGKKYGKCCGRK